MKKGKRETLQGVIDKFFGDERTLHFNIADIIQCEHYLSYRKESDGIVLTVGSDEGETDIAYIENPKNLTKAIELIIHNEWDK